MEERIQQLIEIGRWCWQNRLVPATGGNFSARLDSDTIAITRSGTHKGKLTPDDFIKVQISTGKLLSQGKPSAETPLHLHAYRQSPQIGAVLHTHSRGATVLSRIEREKIAISNFELLKAIAGICHPEEELQLPIFPNLQDTEALAQLIQQFVEENGGFQKAISCGYVLRGHGLYCWGRNPDEAFRHLEAIEFLLDCELTERQFQTKATA